jgi:hypothetical protein
VKQTLPIFFFIPSLNYKRENSLETGLNLYGMLVKLFICGVDVYDKPIDLRMVGFGNGLDVKSRNGWFVFLKLVWIDDKMTRKL